MAKPSTSVERRGPTYWIVVCGVLILLVFLYFYQPFTSYLTASLPHVRFSNLVFWFTSLVAVIGFALAHWQSFRRNIIASGGELQVQSLLFDTLQIAVLTAIIFTAGATLQAIEKLSEYLINRGAIFDPVFGKKLLAILLLVILAIIFYLLHQAVRAFRNGKITTTTTAGKLDHRTTARSTAR